MQQFRLFLVLVLAITSCKTMDSGRSLSSASYRDMLVPDKEISDIPFDFCPEKPAFSAANAMWMSYFAISQYTHFGIVGPRLEKFGFGDRGDGEAYRKYWYGLRLKRIAEGKVDTDDTWKDEAGRLAKLESLRSEYKTLYKEDYTDDGKSSVDFEKEIVATSSHSKIRFISGGSIVDGKFVKGSTQVLYAEHPKKGFSIISFRGTEFDERSDLLTDLALIFKAFEDIGAVHSGFYDAYREVEDSLLSILKERNAKETKPVRLFITGHSLGGTLANLLTAKIALLHKKGELSNIVLESTYTLGSPRVGNGAFANALDEMTQDQTIGLYRIRNHQDSITALPPSYGYETSYWHAGALIYIAKDGKSYFGNGFEAIEKNSDYLTSYPTDPRDHDTGMYFAAMKSLYQANRGQNLSNCDSPDSMQIFTPFYENPSMRQKNQTKKPDSP